MKTIAVAVAQDETVLEAVYQAKKDGIANAILIGNEDLIRNSISKMGIPINEFEIINEADKVLATRMAAKLILAGKADMLMKGLIDTASFLKVVLDKEMGFRTNKILSHVAVFFVPALDRIILITDAALNIKPDLKLKKDIIENAVEVAIAIGISNPKVAVVCATETLSPDMPATIDAAALAKMADRGQLKDCLVDGPLALDNAINEKAAIHKGIVSQVAGHADIILVPNIETGNVMYKTLTYMANAKNGGLLAGAKAPVILTSRTDSSESKLLSIALATLAAKN